MVKKTINEIPAKFLVDPEPAIPVSSDENSDISAVPIVDMKSLFDGETKIFELENLHSACKEWGIFQV